MKLIKAGKQKMLHYDMALLITADTEFTEFDIQNILL